MLKQLWLKLGNNRHNLLKQESSSKGPHLSITFRHRLSLASIRARLVQVPRPTATRTWLDQPKKQSLLCTKLVASHRSKISLCNLYKLSNCKKYNLKRPLKLGM